MDKKESLWYIKRLSQGGDKVFHSAAAYHFVLRKLKKAKDVGVLRLYAFCLFPDGIHLVVGCCNDEQLGLCLSMLCREFLKKFPGTVESICVKKDIRIRDHFELVEYVKEIEFMPVRRELARTPAGYEWSSYSYRVLGNSEKEGLLSY